MQSLFWKAVESKVKEFLQKKQTNKPVASHKIVSQSFSSKFFL